MANESPNDRDRIDEQPSGDQPREAQQSADNNEGRERDAFEQLEREHHERTWNRRATDKEQKPTTQ